MYLLSVFLLCFIVTAESCNKQAEQTQRMMSPTKVQLSREITDLAKIVGEAVERIADGREIVWWDMHAVNPAMADYQEYKLKFEIDKLIYKTPIILKNTQRQCDERWFHNNQRLQARESEMSSSCEVLDTFTWRVSRGILTKLEDNAEAGLPNIIRGHLAFRTQIPLHSTEPHVIIEKETLQMKERIRVTPRTSVRALWEITEQEVLVPWEAEVKISGSFAIWYRSKVDGHYLYFYDITNILKVSDLFLDRSWKTVSFKAYGNFTAIYKENDEIKTYEYPLKLNR